MPSDEKQEKICNDLPNKDTKLIMHSADVWEPGNTCSILQKRIEYKSELVEKYGHYLMYVPEKRV